MGMTGGDRHDIGESVHAGRNEAALWNARVAQLPILPISPRPDGAIFFESQAVGASHGHGFDGIDARNLRWSGAIHHAVVAQLALAV